MIRDSLPRLSLRANFLWMLAGNGVFAVSQWGILSLLAKLGTSEQVGMFVLGSAIAGPVIMFTNMQLQSVLATDHRSLFSFPEYLGTRGLSSLLAVGVVAVIAFLHDGGSMGPIIVVFGVAKAFESLSDLVYGLAQRKERMDTVAVSLIGRGALSLLAVGVVFGIHRGVLPAVAVLAAAWAVPLLVFDLPRARSLLRAEGPGPAPSIRPRISRRRYGELVRLSLPLGLVMLCISLEVNIPRYAVAGSWGASSLGIFSAVAYVIVAGNTVAGALAQASIPRFAALFGGGEFRAFASLAAKMVLAGLFLGAAGLAVAALAGRPLLRLLYTEEYAASQPLFVWLMAAGGLGYVASLLGAPVTAMRRFGVQLKIHLVAVLVNLAASVVLVAKLGLVGGAVALGLNALCLIAGYGSVLILSLRKATRAGRTGSPESRRR